MVQVGLSPLSVRHAVPRYLARATTLQRCVGMGLDASFGHLFMVS